MVGGLAARVTVGVVKGPELRLNCRVTLMTGLGLGLSLGLGLGGIILVMVTVGIGLI